MHINVHYVFLICKNNLPEHLLLCFNDTSLIKFLFSALIIYLLVASYLDGKDDDDAAMSVEISDVSETSDLSVADRSAGNRRAYVSSRRFRCYMITKINAIYL